MIEVRNLTKHYFYGKKKFTAVHNVSFSIQKGEVLGLVGESGSGKSTLGKMLLALVSPTEGRIFFDGQEIANKREKGLYRRMQMIFQDPFSSLNPKCNIEQILKEPTTIHGLPSRVDELLDLIGLPKSAKPKYPHELSGGQRQRICIARSIALNPDFIVCDEPVSSLDISTQAQIINLLLQLKRELHLTLLFIGHDICMVRYISDKIAVMKEGVIVEIGDADQVCAFPQSPYTELLLSSARAQGQQLPQLLNQRLHSRETTDFEKIPTLQ